MQFPAPFSIASFWWTASGFAILVGWLLLFVFLAHWAATRFSQNLQQRRRASNLVVCTALMLAFSLVVRRGFLPEVEWNPMFTPTKDFLGTYSDGHREIVFHPDQTYTARNIPHLSKTGTWRKDDWNLYLNSGSHTMRHIIVEGRSHVLVEEIDDLDAWDGEVGLPRVGPGVAPSTQPDAGTPEDKRAQQDQPRPGLRFDQPELRPDSHQPLRNPD